MDLGLILGFGLLAFLIVVIVFIPAMTAMGFWGGERRRKDGGDGGGWDGDGDGGGDGGGGGD